MHPFQIPSILITDDDSAFRETIREMLEPFGYHLAVASDGEEALQIVERDPVHLLLLDMHMPRLTGLETAKRAQRLGPAIPWILLSARVDETLLKQAQNADAFSVLSKPVSRFTIAQNVRLALERAYGWTPRTDN